MCRPASTTTDRLTKQYKPEENVAKLRQGDVLVSHGPNIADAIRRVGMSEVPYDRWQQEYAGSASAQIKRLKDIEQKNTHLRNAVFDLTLKKDSAAGGQEKLPNSARRRAYIGQARDIRHDVAAQDLMSRCQQRHSESGKLIGFDPQQPRRRPA